MISFEDMGRSFEYYLLERRDGVPMYLWSGVIRSRGRFSYLGCGVMAKTIALCFYRRGHRGGQLGFVGGGECNDGGVRYE